MSEIEWLQDRILELECLLGMHQEFPPEWGLTATERVLLGVLMRREVVTTEAWLVVRGRGYNPPVNARGLLGIFIHKLRRKAASNGLPIVIHNWRGEWGCTNGGYFLTADSRRALVEAIQASRSVHQPIMD